MPIEKKHLIVFSDSCFGQNKNITLVAFWMYLVQSGRFNTIEHKYLVPGHTYLPCDREFWVIEKKKRTLSVVYTPEGWVDLVRKARRTNPFQVIYMKAENFISSENLMAKITKRKVSQKKAKVLLSKVSCLKITADTPFMYWFKCDYTET